VRNVTNPPAQSLVGTESADPPLTILIVDDEPHNCKLLELLLRADGYLTVTAASAAEALAAVAKSPPDLIMLDIIMPEMDGYQLAAILKADPATLHIPIVMLTAKLDGAARLAGLQAGAEEFLTKPFEAAELRLRIRNLLRLKLFSDSLRIHTVILERQVQARADELQRFRVGMDATADAITLVDHTTMRFVEVNAAACSMFGYTRDEMLQIGPAQLGAGTTEQLRREYDSIITGGGADVAPEKRFKRRDGSELLVEAHRHVQRSGADWIIVGVMRNVAERNDAEKRLFQMEHFDVLTGLPNRKSFYTNLGDTLAQAPDRSWHVALLCIDLDHFKNVNDTRGHAVGDELLCQVSGRLLKCVRIRDTVARLGGDEFGIVVAATDGEQRAHLIASRIREALRVPFALKDHEVSVTASVGIALSPDDATDTETLIQYADMAMYQAKGAGRNTSRFFKARMNTSALARLELETALRKAVENEEFVLHFQPKVEVRSGRVCGLEALLRWQRPGVGLVAPREFIGVLEDTGLILPVGQWVIAAACREIAAWRAASVDSVPVSVNVAGRQFSEGDVEGDVTRALAEHHVAANLLEVEMTESSLMMDPERTVKSLRNLRNLGVGVSIDDFGTGYSSLAYLRRFPLDKLKIDRAFIHGVTTNAEDAAIALAIIRMAHTLKLKAVAEGVETAAQLAWLQNHDCDQAQGYLFSLPVPAADIGGILSRMTCRSNESGDLFDGSGPESARYA
jgi:diguanylate cyclase (GGDEF)-like protein/PAS domain S-box-containing protein